MIRPAILEALEDYRRGEHPYPFGKFVTAVLANDFVGAFQHADDENLATLHDYASFLYNRMPARTGDPMLDTWGSYEAVANTIASQRAAHAEEEDAEMSS